MKKDIRDKLLKKRNSITPEAREIKEAAIKKRLLASDDFRKAGNVLFYASFQTEVDTLNCLQDAIKLGKKVALPLVDNEKRELRLYWIKDISELVPGYMRIPEPGIITENRETGLENIDVVIIPGAGFDIKGNRIGYGAGYYDRLLSKSQKKITTIGLAFDEQIVEEIPAEPYDKKVEKIITDKRLICCTD